MNSKNSTSETLSVRNFLTIRQADLKVKRFNVIIGQQATGKSVLAKLLFFFRDFLGTIMFDNLVRSDDKRAIKKRALDRFEEYFPRYVWNDQPFEIEYALHNVVVTLSNKKLNSRSSLQFSYSENLSSLYRKAKATLEARNNDPLPEGERRTGMLSSVLRDVVWQSSLASVTLQDSIFIPASRSVFSLIEDNVFAFMKRDIAIDPFVKAFGERYQSARSSSRSNSNNSRNSLPEKYRSQVASIMLGDYVFDNGKDYLIPQGERKRVNISNASSGQQEALPMLIVLAAQLHTSLLMYIIEEPEAHLFPTSQKKVVELFAEIYNNEKCSFFITTHSPYILTAINNFVEASKVDEAGNDEEKKRLYDLVPAKHLLRYQDVSAYTIDNGVLKSICDDETELIGATILDSVSDEFSRIYDGILELSYSENKD